MITLISHGFKYGRPEANFVFDVSYLVNPWRNLELRNAPREKIIEFMNQQEGFSELINSMANLISIYESLWPNDNLVFAFCCSAGEYRSPVVVEAISDVLKNRNIKCEINHGSHSKI